jgi:ABC-type sulfate transport system permease component
MIVPLRTKISVTILFTFFLWVLIYSINYKVSRTWKFEWKRGDEICWLSCLDTLVLLLQKLYLALQSFDFGHIWRKLFQKFVRTRFDITKMSVTILFTFFLWVLIYSINYKVSRKWKFEWKRGDEIAMEIKVRENRKGQSCRR